MHANNWRISLIQNTRAHKRNCNSIHICTSTLTYRYLYTDKHTHMQSCAYTLYIPYVLVYMSGHVLAFNCLNKLHKFTVQLDKGMHYL